MACGLCRCNAWIQSAPDSEGRGRHPLSQTSGFSQTGDSRPPLGVHALLAPTPQTGARVLEMALHGLSPGPCALRGPAPHTQQVPVTSALGAQVSSDCTCWALGPRTVLSLCSHRPPSHKHLPSPHAWLSTSSMPTAHRLETTAHAGNGNIGVLVFRSAESLCTLNSNSVPAPCTKINFECIVELNVKHKL